MGVTFSIATKAELCREANGRKCCALAECYGLLLYCNTFTPQEIKLITENRALVTRLPRLFRRAFGFPIGAPVRRPGRATKYVFSLTDEEKISRIFDAFGLTGDTLVALHINLAVLEEECCRASFLRGAFLAGGSVTDPAKRYHLELVTDHFNVSRQTYSLLLEMGFEPKESSRGGNFIVYFKQSSAIEDFLTLIGAPVAAMELMALKVEKDMRNTINRKVNCDTANVSKTVEAAMQQIQAIGIIERTTGLDALPQKLRETARLRLANPEMSLSELAAASGMTKSCLSHRMRKIIEISSTLK
jgi:DNA-binding protein WhiA